MRHLRQRPTNDRTPPWEYVYHKPNLDWWDWLLLSGLAQDEQCQRILRRSLLAKPVVHACMAWLEVNPEPENKTELVIAARAILNSRRELRQTKLFSFTCWCIARALSGILDNQDDEPDWKSERPQQQAHEYHNKGKGPRWVRLDGDAYGTLEEAVNEPEPWSEFLRRLLVQLDEERRLARVQQAQPSPELAR